MTRSVHAGRAWRGAIFVCFAVYRRCAFRLAVSVSISVNQRLGALPRPDRIGNKKYQEDLQNATESELYGYDDVYRLTSFKRGQLNQEKTDVSNPSRTQTWTLDPLGNWDSTVLDGTTETRVHNSVNELTQRTIGQDPAISLTYDDAGNLTQDGSADGDHQYVWDSRNRLLEVQESQSGSWNTVGEYKYDAKGRRVLKVVTNKGDLNGTTRFLWGGDADWQCLEERAGDGDLVARYTYAPDYVDAVAVQERDLNADDDFGDANEVVYYHSSTLFSVYALSDASESVVERDRYDAYGACTVLDADGGPDGDGVSDVRNPSVLAGGVHAEEAPAVEYRSRLSSPYLGRFSTRDPIGYLGTMNLYGYVSGHPMLLVDPFGLVAGCSGTCAAMVSAIESRFPGVTVTLATPGLGTGDVWILGADTEATTEIGDPIRVAYIVSGEAFLRRLRWIEGRGGPVGQPLWQSFFPGIDKKGPYYGKVKPHKPPCGLCQLLDPSFLKYLEWDFGGEYVAFAGRGFARLTCRDSRMQVHHYWFDKTCFGPMVSASVSVHALSGMEANRCPEAYKEWFTECSAPFVFGWLFGPGGSIFWNDKVKGSGLCVGIGGGCARCHYRLLGESGGTEWDSDWQPHIDPL